MHFGLFHTAATLVQVEFAKFFAFLGRGDSIAP